MTAPVHRPALLLDPATGVHGLRAAGARTEAGVRRVDVWLYTTPPADLAAANRWRFTAPPGGRPVLVAAATADGDRIVLTLAGDPDPGRYRLDVLPGPTTPFDPLRTWLPVRLRPDCDDGASWLPAADPPPVPRPSPVHDYLARDWAALRQALVEFLQREDPDADLSPADPDIAVAELFAHVGDLLHYRLDRQATEAYLETARRRTSVRRHTRLVDYRLGEAVAARTRVLVQPPPGAAPLAVPAGAVAADAPGSPLAYTVEAALTVRPELGEIPLYDWSGDADELPTGATECVLVRPAPADPLGDGWLAAGDLLAFEVVDAGDTARQRAWAARTQTWPAGGVAGPAFRDPLPSRPAHVVRLTAVTPITDPLGPGLPLYAVRWAAAEALPRPYPVTVDERAGAPEVTVARANLVSAHHGRLAAGPAALAAIRPGDYRLDAATAAPVARRADGRPYRLDVDVTLPSGGTVQPDLVPSLVEVADPVLACVLETEDGEPPLLRFRTGATGLLPPGGSTVRAAYEVGGGTAGNLPANALRVLEHNTAGPGLPPAWQPLAAARNPVPAAGGADPEPLDQARRDAPEAYAANPRRAVTPADHAAYTGGQPGVQRAAATREWSGSWPVIRTAVDLTVDTAEPAERRLELLRSAVDDVRMLGTEVAVVAGTPVGLYLGLTVCALPTVDTDTLRGQVLALLRPGTARRPGFFHPDRMTLGAPVYVSAVVAAVAALPGVDRVEVTQARRTTDPPDVRLDVLTVGPGEVPVLDDDPAQPARGRLDVNVGGGR
ncbi:hypothetical protein Drose_13565 [Dactylosporangium roseum]|uniref:Baseplate protein J-like domain-containing protein n=1 Tax=Dactylosporangium roseum TaxID=47989 RepID=A0ABY5ZAU6_9ACTN|nr:hypothetical protein [Dactylosporangium roseum]UWZ39159.1 hypothetical protein Drose_13565 [Dactylosporangium roseum]